MTRPRFELKPSCMPFTRSTNATVQTYFAVYRTSKLLITSDVNDYYSVPDNLKLKKSKAARKEFRYSKS